MLKRDTPKLVRLPNGRTFYGQYKRTKHANLPANIRSERVYRQRAAPKGRRRQPRQAANQQGQEIGYFFKMAKKIEKSKIACNIGKKVLEYSPDVYENLSGKVKNKKLKEILDLDSAEILVRYGSSYGQNKHFSKKLF